ncbi:glycoside hydrolase family 32 protein [Formicincola oecophyllae]|nr:glycoside hydrolase family 32 protein [Formicincola oecophyllae]
MASTPANTSSARPGADAAQAGRPRPVALASYRPAIHFTPPHGFMNDPNGLIWDGKVFHLYYQYNPHGTHAGYVHWGHATSPDLYNWHDQPVAISVSEAGQAFSGSVVLDRHNRSGLFPQLPLAHQEAADLKAAIAAISGPGAASAFAQNKASQDGEGGLVAIYTRSRPHSQTQFVAWSPNQGTTYLDWPGDPVLDIASDSYRDPKVFWHEASQKWVMALVQARARKVSFYGSADLLHWRHLSDFGPAGLRGVDYECPCLVELPVAGEGTPGESQTRWVLFVSINPGAPLGGSGTQYFVGDFDGERFTPENTLLGLLDFAKDCYAMQTYNDMPSNDVPGGAAVYLAWLSNWQYCNELPTQGWRGAMTLPREMRLRRDGEGWLRLVQQPWQLERLREAPLPFRAHRLGPMERAHTPLPANLAVEIEVTVRLEQGPGSQPGRFVIAFVNRGTATMPGEELTVGVDLQTNQLWLDRSGLRGYSQPFFTGQFSEALPAGLERVELRIILDASTLEVYAQRGMCVGTALVFPANPLNGLELRAENAQVTVHEARVWPLRPTMAANRG